MQYHIDSKNQVAKCSARRACPLGGKHFEDPVEAMMSVFDRDFSSMPNEVENDEVERVYFYEQGWYYNDSTIDADIGDSLYGWMENEVYNHDLSEQEESDLAKLLVEAGANGDWYAATDAFLQQRKKQQ